MEDVSKLSFGGCSGLLEFFCADLNDPNNTFPRACNWCILYLQREI
jgi:hypothetical protein